MITHQTFEEYLNVLEGNVKRLLSELAEVREENKALKIQLEEKEELIKGFQNQSKITKLVNGIGPEGEDAEKLKIRIEENIQLIDKCIARLGRNKIDI